MRYTVYVKETVPRDFTPGPIRDLIYMLVLHFYDPPSKNFDFYTWDPYNLSLVADQMLTKTNYFSQKVL